MKAKKEDLPIVIQSPNTVIRNLPGYGNMTVAFNEIPAGTDIAPLLEGLENDSCQCPHWGYLVEGAMRIIYDDESEELIRTGDVFYMPPGHTAIVEENTKILDFSPTNELDEVMEHMEKKMAANK